MRVRPGGRRGSRPSDGVGGRWTVAVPAWGERCVAVFLRYSLPALARALRELGSPAGVVVWTDQPDRVLSVAGGLPNVEMRDVPGPDGAFESMSACHRQVLQEAGPRDRVVLLTADMVVSREVLATSARLCAAGVQLVCCAAPRALQDAGCPTDATGRELLAWAWENRHPMTRECTWPEGRSYDVWRMYFERGEEVAARVFLPHPLVVVPHGRKMEFRPTIDVNLAGNFSRAVTHLITSPEEGAVVELSPEEKEFVVTDSMACRMTTRGPSAPPFVSQFNARHRMFFGKKIVIRGTGDVDDEAVVKRMLG